MAGRSSAVPRGLEPGWRCELPGLLRLSLRLLLRSCRLQSLRRDQQPGLLRLPRSIFCGVPMNANTAYPAPRLEASYLLVTTLFLGVSQLARGQQNYTTSEALAVPGASYSEAVAVSADGSVVVGRMGHRAFQWRRESGGVLLPELEDPWPLADPSASPNSVTADGAIIC